MKHVIVIGAGVTGLAAAYCLNKAGAEVTVCEKNDGQDNCSYGNAGLIAPRHVIPLASPGAIRQGLLWMLRKDSPFYIKPRLNRELIDWGLKFRKASNQKQAAAAGPLLRDMLVRNQQLIMELEKDENLQFGFEKSGHLTLCETEKGLAKEAESADSASALGVKAEVLSAEEVKALEPAVEMDIQGAVYYPDDAHLTPDLLMAGLKARLKEKGVNFEFNTEITGITESKEGKVTAVSSDGRRFEGTHLVLCSGAHTSVFAKQYHWKMPLQAGKGYSISLKNPPAVPKLNLLLSEKKVAITPMEGFVRFAGTMEIAGLDKSITPARAGAVKKAAAQFYPGYDGQELEEQKVWAGLRPCSADGMPYVGKPGAHKNIYVSTGHAMVGMSLGFTSGEVISQLITGGEAPLAHPLTDPNRFT